MRFILLAVIQKKDINFLRVNENNCKQLSLDKCHNSQENPYVRIATRKISTKENSFYFRKK